MQMQVCISNINVIFGQYFLKKMRVGLLNSFKINCKNNFDTILNNN